MHCTFQADETVVQEETLVAKSQNQKVDTWQTCVFLIALYGLEAAGVDQRTIMNFSKTMLSQL